LNREHRSILLEAEEIVNGSRNCDYGDSNDNLENIATIARSLGVNIDGAGVCRVMIAVKLGRQKFKHKRDNLVDACGYLEMLNRWEDRT